jgi:hypothetical protein
MGQKEKVEVAAVAVEVEAVDDHGDDSSSNKKSTASLVIWVSAAEIWRR